MEILRGEIGLRAYGNHDPLIAYKEESSRAYEEMVSKVREETAMFLLNFKVQIERTVPIHVTKKDLTPEDIAKIRKIAEDKIREQKAGEVNPTTAPNNSKAQDDLDKLMKAPTSIDMVTNMTENTQAKTKGKVVGRNDLCPCGSGLKYKNCCGKNAK